MFKKIFFICLLILILVSPTYALAQKFETSFSSEFLKIDNPSNHFDRLIEKIILFTKFNEQSKAEYMMSLLDKRLADLNFVVTKDRGNLIEEISSRYASFTGELGNYFLENNLKNKKLNLIKKFEIHKKVLIKIQKPYSSDSPFRMLLQHDINTINIIRDKLERL